MIEPAEARARATRWLATGGGVEIFEFELGYVVWPTPESAGIGAAVSGPPVTTGTPRAVVDRETGELTTFGSLPISSVAEEYRALHAARRRFSPDVLQDLYLAGWRPGRDHRAGVDAWLERYAEVLSGFELSPAARRVLDEFGGLVLPQRGPGGGPGGGFPSSLFPFEMDDSDNRSLFGRPQGFSEETGIGVFPIGVYDDEGSDLVVDVAGRVLVLHWADDVLVGDSFESALDWLLCGRGRLVSLDEDGTSPV